MLASHVIQTLGELKAMVQLTFGDASRSEEPIFIDARFDKAKLLDALPDGAEPDTKVTIKPEYIVQFYEGALDPRLGMFKDALFHEPSMPKGNIPVAVRLADLLTPHPPVFPKPASSFDAEKLPKPTEDVGRVKNDIKEFGYG